MFLGIKLFIKQPLEEMKWKLLYTKLGNNKNTVYQNLCGTAKTWGFISCP